MRILVVDDDRRLTDVLRRGLEEDGYAVDVCADGASALMQAEAAPYDAIVLDVMLPYMDGFEVARELRQAGVHTPILMLTARDTVDDAVSGLEAGADDYLRKPFAFRELRARLQSIIRRGAAGPTSTQLQVGDLVLDMARHEARSDGRRVSLTNREFQVLAYLMQNPGRVMTRIMIEAQVWGGNFPGLSNTVDVHIKRLRQKLDRPGEQSCIETIRGAGYRLRAGPP
jgi:two-component system OmpR family response regulator